MLETILIITSIACAISMAALAISLYTLAVLPARLQAINERLQRQYESLETRTITKSIEASNELVTAARNDVMAEVAEVLQAADERFGGGGAGRGGIPQASFRNL